MLAAAADNEHVAALVRVYQGAPAKLRPDLATAAGTAVFLSGGGTVEIETIFRHADRTGENARLTALVEMSKKIGANPHELRAHLTTQVKPALDDADVRWTAALAAKSFPNTDRATAVRDATDRPRTTRDQRTPGQQPER